MDNVEIIIPITLFICLCVGWVFYLIYQTNVRKLLSEEIRAAIEKGVDIPFPEPKVTNNLLRGLIFAFLGLAFLGAFLVGLGEPEPAYIIGLPPLGIGLAYLVYFWYSKK